MLFIQPLAPQNLFTGAAFQRGFHIRAACMEILENSQEITCSIVRFDKSWRLLSCNFTKTKFYNRSYSQWMSKNFSKRLLERLRTAAFVSKFIQNWKIWKQPLLLHFCPRRALSIFFCQTSLYLSIHYWATLLIFTHKASKFIDVFFLEEKSEQNLVLPNIITTKYCCMKVA